MLHRIVNLVCFILAITLVPQCFSAEEEKTEPEMSAEPESAETAEIEAARQQALARKKMQINGYQPITVAGQEIDATYLEEVTGDKHGVIVFFHDKSQQFEMPTVVSPLRQALPQYGWSTITFAMDYTFEDHILLSPSTEMAESMEEASMAEEPKQVVMADDVKDGEKADAAASEDESSAALPPISNDERIEAVLSFIEAKDYDRVIFLGHGEGGEIAANIMAPLNKAIDALILIDVDDFESYELFETIVKPTIDLYAENGAAQVKSAVKQRKKVMKVNAQPMYSTRMILGATSSFYGFEGRLTTIIRSWLHKQFLAEKR